MADVSFPQINTYASRFPQLDFSMIAKLPQLYRQGQEVGREDELRNWIKANPNAPIDEVAKHLMAADPVRGAQLIQSINNQNALNDYRTQSLMPPEQRLYNWAYPPTGKGPISGTASTPAPDGVSRLGPDGRPTPAEFVNNQMLSKTLTPGQRSVDEGFAKDYRDWIAGGGYAGIQKTQGQLKAGIDALGKSDSISGPFVGTLGKIADSGGVIGGLASGAQSYFLPESRNTRQQIEEAIQTNLRRVLGSQYTQQEGENLLARTYDPMLDEKTNAQRAQRVLDNLDRMAKAKDEAAKYYEQHGTLAGWQGSLLTDQNQIDIGDGSKDQSRLEQAPYDAALANPPKRADTAGQYNTESEAVAAASRSRGSAAEGVGAPPPPPPNALGRLRTALKAHPEAEEEIKAAFERRFGNGQKGYADHYIYGEGR